MCRSGGRACRCAWQPRRTDGAEDGGDEGLGDLKTVVEVVRPDSGVPLRGEGVERSKKLVDVGEMRGDPVKHAKEGGRSWWEWGRSGVVVA